MEKMRRRHPWLPEVSPEEAHQGLKGIIRDLSKRLVPYAALRIGIDPVELESRLKSARLEPSPDFNGCVQTSDNWKTFEIVINEGLMMFYHKMVKVFVASVRVRDTQDDSTHGSIEPTRIVSVCRRLIEAYFQGRLFTQAGFSFDDFGKAKVLMTTALVHCCECFAIAHEFGHLVVQLSKTKLPEHATAKKLVEDFLQLFSTLDGNMKARFVAPWTEETKSRRAAVAGSKSGIAARPGAAGPTAGIWASYKSLRYSAAPWGPNSGGTGAHSSNPCPTLSRVHGAIRRHDRD
jgi:hypothetical protein